jgi:hypothetical protein
MNISHLNKRINMFKEGLLKADMVAEGQLHILVRGPTVTGLAPVVKQWPHEVSQSFVMLIQTLAERDFRWAPQFADGATALDDRHYRPQVKAIFDELYADGLVHLPKS